MKVAIIGAGISGLTMANLLKEENDITIYEKDNQPGGLIKCKRVEGSLFHTCGGHIFNSKCQHVLEWFWKRFDKEKEFVKADRNSVVFLHNDLKIPYPIEDHAYLLDNETQKYFIRDLLSMACSKTKPDNFEDFLKSKFGNTLYKLYFQPYNEKIWKRDLKKVPLEWLEGKLPMPTVEEIILNNMNHVDERSFVHSTFFYEKHNGSQFIVNRLSEGINIKYNSIVDSIEPMECGILVNGEIFDSVVFCGNIKQLPLLLKNIELNDFKTKIESLESHGTTSVFCEIDSNPYSWIYLPSKEYQSHRIICTGNFSPSNNADGKMTGTVEFTDYISESLIKTELLKMPLNPQYITHQYNEFTYPIQDTNTREMIRALKNYLKNYNIFFTGRFADWEYYNMDVAIDAAINTYFNYMLKYE